MRNSNNNNSPSFLRSFFNSLLPLQAEKKLTRQPLRSATNSPEPPALPYRYLVTLCILIAMSLSLSLSAQPPMIRLQMSGPNNMLDETIVYYQSGATTGFDNDFDAYKLTGPNPQAIIAQRYDNTLLQINGVAPVTEIFAIPVLTTTPNTGTYTLFATDFQDMPAGTSVKLIDLYTNTQTDIRTTNYTFLLNDTTATPRFSLEITSAPPLLGYPFSLDVFQPSCTYNAGKCIATVYGTGSWNYTWTDASGTIVRTSLNTNGPDTLETLQAGTFTIKIEDVNTGGIGTDIFTIDPSIVTPIASFTSLDTVLLSQGGLYTAQNSSENASGYLWHFGDDDSYSSDSNATHIFVNEGSFSVSLTAFNSAGCVDSSIRTITVIQDTTSTQDTTSSVGMKEIATTEIKWCTLGNNQFLAKNTEKQNFEVTLFDMTGKQILSETSNGTDLHFDFAHLSSGTYILNLIRRGGQKTNLQRLQFIIE